MAVKRLCSILLVVSLALVARATCPAICTATSNNAAWPCRYHSNGCQVGGAQDVPTLARTPHPFAIPLHVKGSPVLRDPEVTVAANPARVGAADVNVAVISPYSGGLGELMTMVEPAIAAAAQDVENSNFLPGFRMNLFLGDSKCSVPGATQATIEALARSPTKHAVLADSCSAACEAMNDATQFFNVLQVSPGCISESLSDSTRFPYFTRMAPSYRFNVQTLYEFTKLMSFQRVGIVVGYRSINTLGVNYLSGLMRDDVAAGRYNWTVLFTVQITSAGNIADAQSAAEEIERKDSRINIVALYQTEGAMFLCQTHGRNLFSPFYSFMIVSGWWNPGFILERSGASDCPCTVTELHRAAYGVIAADRGPMLNTQDVHGLSGRRFADIYGNYTEECLSFGNGTGVCNHQWAGYFYDGVWLIASILHTYLVEENRSVADLATPAARQALEALSLQVDFAGTTGRVRQFSSPDLEGDRDGVILLRQAGGPPEDTFNHLAYRTDTGILFQTDVVWSPDPAHRISCGSGTCDLVNGFRPADRSSSCPDGRVWINEHGCSECPQGECLGAYISCFVLCSHTFWRFGRFASSGMAQCEPCSIGSFASATGSASCQLLGRKSEFRQFHSDLSPKFQRLSPDLAAMLQCF
ncbi:Gabbr1 [Symbiodinium sp. CCMP2592]|nr:Gabbr1 [Symbiodinium sp. CCMP2592]